MTFRQLNARKTAYGFEAHITPANIVLIGKVVGLARKLDSDVIVSTNPQGGLCELTIHSNDPNVAAMVKAYSR